VRKLSLAHQTMFADLIQRCLDAGFDAQFPEGGNFVRHTRGERGYWYYVPSAKGGSGSRRPIYVGPDDDPEVASRVARFAAIKDNFRDRRAMVTSLRAAGLPTPDAMTGDVVEALWKAGLFRLRGVLVGTMAFQTYAGLLGARFPTAALATGDADFAQFHSISVLSDDTMPPVLDVLRSVDGSFRPVPHLSDPTLSSAYVNSRMYRVEFLVPNRGSDRHQGRPTRMPALGGAGAEPLRYLDFLIYHPVQSVLLHKGGIPVTVPAPERYAVHKLILADLRREDTASAAKAGKDVHQAIELVRALTADRRAVDLGLAWVEASDRGPRWAERLRSGRARLEQADRTLLEQAVREGMAVRGGRITQDRYGIDDADRRT